MKDDLLHTAQAIGALLVWGSVRICHWAFTNSIRVWFQSPVNRTKYFKQFRHHRLKTGTTDYTTMYKDTPSTLSETFGDENTAEGQTVKASVRPSTMLMAFGGVMMRLGGDSMWSWLLHTIRGCMSAFGLLVVLETPVVSGAGGGNREIRLGKRIADTEMLYQLGWVALHFYGFGAFVAPVILVEMPIAIREIMDYFNQESIADDGVHWPHEARQLWLTLAILRAICGIGVLATAPFLATTSRNKNMTNHKYWRVEYVVGEFGAIQMMFNALSVFLLPGRGPYSTGDIILIGLLLFETFRIFLVDCLRWFVKLLFWNVTHWESACRSMFQSTGPIMVGLRQNTGQELECLHAVQAGKPDKTELIVRDALIPLAVKFFGTGSEHKPIQALIITPNQVYENIKAMELHETSPEFLPSFFEDLAAVLDCLETAETLSFPHGDLFKCQSHRPLLSLTLKDYAEEIEDINPEVEPNTEPLEWGEDEVGYDITHAILSDARGAVLARMPLITVMKQAGLMLPLVELFGTLLQGCRSPEAAELSSEDSHDEAASLKPSRGDDFSRAEYEIQVCGVRSYPPTIVLRTLAAQELPPGWSKSSLRRVNPVVAQS
eukprot:TRINITY_DN3798_c0_g1_i1.p1 TRINITY_DN3798_c0_g1~~TRINITY_DN3798_c0_g1_i1.p1  ORF type:complete len:618 (-),score=96.25 TRINITY_DN3798_c0_g1_i1:86-1897(-)